MTKLTDTERLEVEQALSGYNQSPWRDYGSDWCLSELIFIAENESVERALEIIRRANIRAFRCEEAACGNI